jgi:hypothetical protein
MFERVNQQAGTSATLHAPTHRKAQDPGAAARPESSLCWGMPG